MRYFTLYGKYAVSPYAERCDRGTPGERPPAVAYSDSGRCVPIRSVDPAQRQ